MMVALRSCLLLLTFTCILNITQTYSNDERKTYIVYMGSLPRHLEANSLPSIHMSMAQRVLGSSFAPDAVTHSYHKSFNGFVVKLTEAEAARMRELVGVISVFESKTHPVATTKSWDFIGFPRDVTRQTREGGQGFIESDIVVAVIDTGIRSDHEIFTINDADYPKSEEMKMKWDQRRCPEKCKCNNKIVGTRTFNGGKLVEPPECPDDEIGHGTHVASIIAGGEIEAKGSVVDITDPQGERRTARGGVPWARIAVYKVCRFHEDGHGGSRYGCKDEDILEAFHKAIEDEVKIISVSLDQNTSSTVGCDKEYFSNSYAIGAFHAMEKGILTSVAAGNKGPDPYSMRSYAPWLLSVAASTIGRKFSTTVTVEDGKQFKGVSLNTYASHRENKPLLTACPKSSTDCSGGEILECDGTKKKIATPSDVGALGSKCGVILKSDKPLDVASIYATPATVLDDSDFEKILKYGEAKISKSVVEELPVSTDPSIASISSRGPNPITPDILKPDIAAPGVHILAAWPPGYPISGVPKDGRTDPDLFKYNVQSGTSMACPHVTAAAAYVKSFHLDWSPDAIKSALMTTATEMKPNLNDGAEFAYGAGQINPVKAVDPGLVYNASADDYFNFLCAVYDDSKLSRFDETKKCPNFKDDEKKERAVRNLNLPSFALSVNCITKGNEKDCPVDGSFERNLTNVGPENSKYAYHLSDSLKKSLQIKVDSECLSFEKKGDVKKFTLCIAGNLIEKEKASASSLWMEKVSGSLTWEQVDSCDPDRKIISGGYKVRSPIVVYNGNGSPERKCSKLIVREGIYQFGHQEGKVDASTLVA